MLKDYQKIFISEAEDQGFDIRNYSGRGMYGRECPAFTVDRIADARISVPYSWDNMGLSYIIYCP